MMMTQSKYRLECVWSAKLVTVLKKPLLVEYMGMNKVPEEI